MSLISAASILLDSNFNNSLRWNIMSYRGINGVKEIINSYRYSYFKKSYCYQQVKVLDNENRSIVWPP